MSSRHLQFQGGYNARDLGNVPLVRGGRTQMRVFIRSDTVDHLTAADWEKLEQYGIRSIVDLRNPEEVRRKEWPSFLQRFNLPMESEHDPRFQAEWCETGKWATPLYYKPFLNRFPRSVARIVQQLASARGGVLFHCMAGRDRTGLIAMILLHLAGVNSEEIAADHDQSHDSLSKFYKNTDEVDQRIEIDRIIAESGQSSAEIFKATLSQMDIEQILLENGCSAPDLQMIRSKLAGDAVTGPETRKSSTKPRV